MFKELPVFKCENEVIEATNYLIMALTVYKAAAEVIFDRLFNVTIVCQIIKPLIKLNSLLLGEFYDLKS